MTTTSFVFGAALIGAMAIGSYLIQTHVERAEINVVSKERLLKVTTNDGDTSSEYRNFVYSDADTYTVQDSFWNWHFTSATVYARVKEGSRCRVTLAGYRFGFLSMFQNIIEAECDLPTLKARAVQENRA